MLRSWRTEAVRPCHTVAPVSALVIHTRGNPYAALPAAKAAVLDVLPDVPLRSVQTMEELMARHVAQGRLNVLLLGLFGLLGLVMAAVGIYGRADAGVCRRRVSGVASPAAAPLF